MQWEVWALKKQKRPDLQASEFLRTYFQVHNIFALSPKHRGNAVFVQRKQRNDGEDVT